MALAFLITRNEVFDPVFLIVAAEVTQQPLDRQQLAPMAEAAIAAVGSVPENVVANAGYWNYQHLANPVFANTNLLVPPGAHGDDHSSRLRADHPLVQSMRAKLRTEVGRRLYRARQGLAEPVFAYIKEQRRFRRFSFRGIAKVKGEWALVCLTHNLLKLFRSRLTPTTA